MFVKTDIDCSRVTLAVLAGGEGRRMGYPKSELKILGQPILEYLLDRFTWPGPTLLVTTPGREHPPGWERFDREATDPIENQGPLRGVLTALEAVQAAAVVIVTVDMPVIGGEQLLCPLRKLLANPDLKGMMMRRVINGKSQIEPFPFACRIGTEQIISRRLAEGRRSVHSLAEVDGFTAELAPSDWSASTWTNLNSPEDWRLFMQSFG